MPKMPIKDLKWLGLPQSVGDSVASATPGRALDRWCLVPIPFYGVIRNGREAGGHGSAVPTRSFWRAPTRTLPSSLAMSLAVLLCGRACGLWDP